MMFIKLTTVSFQSRVGTLYALQLKGTSVSGVFLLGNRIMKPLTCKQILGIRSIQKYLTNFFFY